jgi:2-(1,2-epoxy-1,2-dihydrophenyl)acetyl-CoA isomerase
VSDGPHVLVDIADGIGTVTLNRPDRLNAFFGTMREEMADALESMASHRGVRVVIVTGKGRAFCAGADVAYLADLLERRAYDEADLLVEAGRRVISSVIEMPKPVVCALNGPAAGGGANLALACDLRIASERAAIGQTFNRIGLAPDWGGTWLVPRLVGRARAAELFFLADMIGAREAERIGLVNRVVPHEDLDREVRDTAARLLAKPSLPIALAKAALRRSLAADLDQMLDFEVEAQTRAFRSADALEGARAFVEKRPPRFGSVAESEEE